MLPPSFVQVPFFTLPPEANGVGWEDGSKAAQAVFVEGFGKEFDVEAGDAEVGFRWTPAVRYICVFRVYSVEWSVP